jgi:TldD protein
MRLSILFCVLFIGISLSVKAQDKLLDILAQELTREMDVLKKQEVPVYYISYRVDDVQRSSLASSFGAITQNGGGHNRVLTVSVRVGSPELDNFHPLRGNYASLSTNTDFPLSDDALAIQQMVWSATNSAYQQAVNNYTKVKANVAVKANEEDKSPDFILSAPNVFCDEPIDMKQMAYDSLEWCNRLKKYSALFLNDKDIFTGYSRLDVYAERKYFVSSNGDKVAQNRMATHVSFSGTIKAADGMQLPLHKSYFATMPSRLTADAEMTKDAEELVSLLTKLKEAPVAEPFTGPAILSGEASGVFFHEIFGHRIEGQRMKNESDAQTFKKKVNELVLPSHFSVYSDPQQTTSGQTDLNGFYAYDDEGAKGQRVDVVKAGVLNDFLMSRTPIENFLYTNGHGRAQAGLQPAARQSNLVIETSQPMTDAQLRASLVQLLKEQNKPYGYYFKDVVGGFTQTSRINPNAFNVTPVLVYRVYADGRPDEIVRGVDLIGTPLSMFAQIDKAGDTPKVFNGTCGAESGGVPVSAVSPMLLVKTIETQKKMKSQERAFILPRPDGTMESEGNRQK